MTLLERSLSLFKTGRVAVNYIRDTVPIEWRVRPGRSDVEQYSEGELTIVSRRQDFVGYAAELLRNNEPLTPQRGDTIEWQRNGGTDVFEVQQANGDDWYTPVDAYGKLIRVHTKLVETRSA